MANLNKGVIGEWALIERLIYSLASGDPKGIRDDW